MNIKILLHPCWANERCVTLRMCVYRVDLCMGGKCVRGCVGVGVHVCVLEVHVCLFAGGCGCVDVCVSGRM